MDDSSVTATTPVLIIGDAEGDGPVLRFIPPPFQALIRSSANRMSKQKISRLLRVAVKVYPILRKIESRALAPEDQCLQKVPFRKVLQDDVKIERCLRLFLSAWKTNFIRVVGSNGKAVPPHKPRTRLGACGMSVDEAQAHFINIATDQIFSAFPKVKLRLGGGISDPEALPKLRILAQFEPTAMFEMAQATGSQSSVFFTTVNYEVLYALATLKAFQIHALGTVLGSNILSLTTWEPDKIKAISKHCDCMEQIVDLGEALSLLKNGDAIAALCRWDKRDITDKVNAERTKRGQPSVAGPRYETDIGVGRIILGNYFNSLMEEPPDLLAAFGKMIASIRRMDKVDRHDHIEEVRLFFQRFMEFMNTDIMKALGMTDPDPTTFAEALYILEGLFSKPGLGRRFFEGPLQTPEGVRAMAGLKEDIQEMKKRGSIKGGQELKQLLSDSDILDGHIAQFVNFKN